MLQQLFYQCIQFSCLLPQTTLGSITVSIDNPSKLHLNKNEIILFLVNEMKYIVFSKFYNYR